MRYLIVIASGDPDRPGKATAEVYATDDVVQWQGALDRARELQRERARMMGGYPAEVTAIDLRHSGTDYKFVSELTAEMDDLQESLSS
jgi:hypothetical protein